MPNWCNNSLTVSHPDKEMMAKFAAAVKEGNLFDTFIPMPAELRDTTAPSESNEKLMEKYGHSDWYSWALDNWGTKWDNCDGEFELDEDGLSGNGWFDTAWGPPLEAYRKLQDLGFSIDAGYSESGMGFVGTWVDGEEEYIEDFYRLFENENWREEFDANDYILDYLDSEYQYYLESKEEE
jgi:hypothetical protein